jgi:hypothetical protein
LTGLRVEFSQASLRYWVQHPTTTRGSYQGM